MSDHRPIPRGDPQRPNMVPEHLFKGERSVPFARLTIRAFPKDEAVQGFQDTRERKLGQHSVDPVDIFSVVLHKQHCTFPIWYVLRPDDSDEDREISANDAPSSLPTVDEFDTILGLREIPIEA